MKYVANSDSAQGDMMNGCSIKIAWEIYPLYIITS